MVASLFMVFSSFFNSTAFSRREPRPFIITLCSLELLTSDDMESESNLTVSGLFLFLFLIFPFRFIRKLFLNAPLPVMELEFLFSIISRIVCASNALRESSLCSSSTSRACAELSAFAPIKVARCFRSFSNRLFLKKPTTFVSFSFCISNSSLIIPCLTSAIDARVLCSPNSSSTLSACFRQNMEFFLSVCRRSSANLFWAMASALRFCASAAASAALCVTVEFQSLEVQDSALWMACSATLTARVASSRAAASSRWRSPIVWWSSSTISRS
mmetsp:Transcript_20510/g.41042  ORF Transcript_20510/g.41042 Transcript_20510/m.41042 type:complete len:272 (+) Transcript_20510:1583-2398(+)